MENIKYKINNNIDEMKYSHEEICYLLVGCNTWESEYCLSSSYPSMIDNYLQSNSNLVVSKFTGSTNNSYEDSLLSKTPGIDAGKRIKCLPNVKTEYLIDHSDRRKEADMFCNIVSQLLNDTAIDLPPHNIGFDDNVAVTDIREFRQKKRLKKCKSTQNRQGPFICKICDKKFKHRRYLKVHLFTHSGEKPFTCDVCDKKFTRKSHLKAHRLTHTGEKPFTCKDCDMKFAWKCNLKRHILTHTGEKPFTCDV